MTILAGQTYAYFDVRGRGAGTSTVIATAPGYSPDTATNVVTSPKVRLSGGSTINAYSTTTSNVYSTDSLNSAHNRLTDLTVSLRSTDTTIIKVDTQVVIPAGYYYVPASWTITAVSPGTARIIATAPGHAPDTNTWTVNPAKLNLSWLSTQIGARQHYQADAFYVYTPNPRTVSVPVTLTQKQASTVALSTTTPTIASGINYGYFTFAGLVPGLDTIIASATGYLPDTAFVTVTTPMFTIGGLPSSATTTSPPTTLTLYAADSAGNTHYASDTVVVRAVSSDSNVIRPGQPYFRVLKDSYYANPTVQYIGPGTATVTYSDSANSGYRPATTGSVTVTGPSLAIGGSNPGMLGTGQHTSPQAYYVAAPNNVGTPLTVNLVSTGTRVATVPASVTIPAGSNYAYFTITAQDTIGTVQIQASATGYTPTSVNMQVTIPKFTMSVSTQLNTTSPPSAITVYASDANGTLHYPNQDLVVTLASSAPGVATIDSTTVTIPSGLYYSSSARWAPVSAGTALLSASDPRSLIQYRYGTATAGVTVVTPSVSLSTGSQSLGIGQYTDQPYVSVPDTRTTPLTVPLSHSAVPHTSTPSSVDIPAGSNYVYFRITGTSTGSDTITASAAGYTSTSGVVTAGPGRIDPISGWPTSSLKVGDSVQVTLSTRAPNQSGYNVAAATTFALSPNANIQFVSGGSVITSVVVPADGSYVQFYLKGVSSGTGTATITNANYTTYTNSVSVP